MPEDWEQYAVKTSQPQAEDWEQYAVKKKDLPVSPIGAPQLGNGSNPFQSTNTPVAPTVLSAKGQKDFTAQATQQKEAHNQDFLDTSKRLKAIHDGLSPEDQKAFTTATKLGTASLGRDNASATPQEQTDHYNFMQTPVGKTLGVVADLGSHATKGTLAVAKGAAWLTNQAINGGNGLDGVAQNNIDQAFDKADKVADFGLTKGDQARHNDNVLMSNANSLAEFMPVGMMGGGSITPFVLQGFGQGKELMDNAEKSGTEINPAVKKAFILGTGGAMGFLMGSVGQNLFGKIPVGLRGDIASSLTADALKSFTGKELTGEEFQSLLEKGVTKFSEKLQQGGTNFLNHYKKTALDLSALTAANWTLKQGADYANQADGEKQIFGEDTGDLIHGLKETVSATAPVFSAFGSLGDMAKLTPYSHYKNVVVESLMENPSPENVDLIKSQLADHGALVKGWSGDEIDATLQQVDKIAEVAKKLPRGLSSKKAGEAVDLVNGRTDLENQLSEIKASKEGLDPAIKDIPSNGEELLQAKVDQANDKLQTLVTGKSPKFTQDEEKGTFYKEIGGKKEEISQTRYDLENLEKESKKEEPVTETKAEPEVKSDPIAPLAENTQAIPAQKAENEVAKSEVKIGDKATVTSADGTTLGVGAKITNISPDGKFIQTDLGDSYVPAEQAQPEVSKPDSSESPLQKAETDSGAEKATKEETPVSKEELSAPVFAKAEDDLTALKQVDDKSKKYEASIKRLVEAKNAKQITEAEFNQTKARFDDVMAENSGKTAKVEDKPVQETAPFTEHEQAVKNEQPVTILPENSAKTEGGKEQTAQVPKPDSSGNRVEADSGTKEAKSEGTDVSKPKLTAKEERQAAVKGLLDFVHQSRSKTGVLADVGEFGAHVAKVLAAYAKEGIVKLAEVLKTMREDFGDDFVDENKEAIASAHGDIYPEPKTEKDDTQAIYGTKNSVTQALRDGMGLPPIEIPKDRSEDASLNAWKDGTRTPLDIVNGLLDPNTDIYDKSITPNDEPIMREYIKQLAERGNELNKIKVTLQEKIDAGDKEAEGHLASLDQQLLNHYDQMERALNASKLGGNIWHKYGAERQLAIDDQGIVLNSIHRIQTIYGKEMPAEVKKELADLQLKYDNLEARNAKIEEQLKNKAAADELARQAPKRGLFGTKIRKKSAGDFVKERSSILDDLKRDFQKSFQNTYASIPGIPQLTAIAPHILRLTKSLLEENASKLDDVLLKVHDMVKDAVEGITVSDLRDIVAGKYTEKKTLPDLQKERLELQKKWNDLKTQARNKIKIEELEKGIVRAIQKKGEASPIVKDLQQQLAQAKKDASNKFPDVSIEDLKKEISAINNKIDKGDFFKLPTVKRTWETHPEWLKNNKQKNDLKQRLRVLETEAFSSKKSTYMRTLDWINRWGRRVIFFGANAVYTKLSAAVVAGTMVHRPIEQALGVMNSKTFPHIAKNAPIEGNANMATEADFYLETTNPKKIAKNTYDITKTGGTDLSRELSRYMHENHIPVLDLFAADGHQIIKDPIKRGIFEASFKYHMQWYAKNGIDGSHPLLLEAARQAAYRRAEYEILQNTKKGGNAIGAAFNKFENEAILKYNSGESFAHLKGNAIYTKAFLYKFFVPINTVPLNGLERTTLGPRLLLTYINAFGKNRDIKKGILNMSNEEADLIMLQLKKGQVSLAYWTLGFALAGSVAGGLYTAMNPDKDRKVTQMQSDELDYKGIKIPKNAQHTPQFQAMQMGATWRGIHDHYIDDKGASQLKAMAMATGGTLGTALDQVPVLKVGEGMLNATRDEHGANKFASDFKRRIGVDKTKTAANALTSFAGLMGYGVKTDKQNEIEDIKTKPKATVMSGGNEYKLEGKHLKEKEQMNADYLKDNEERLTKQFTHIADKDANLNKEKAKMVTYLQRRDKTPDEIKEKTDELITKYVNRKIATYVNNKTDVIFRNKHKKGNGLDLPLKEE